MKKKFKLPESLKADARAELQAMSMASMAIDAWTKTFKSYVLEEHPTYPVPHFELNRGELGVEFKMFVEEEWWGSWTLPYKLYKTEAHLRTLQECIIACFDHAQNPDNHE